jgi:hypothetical protein
MNSISRSDDERVLLDARAAASTYVVFTAIFAVLDIPAILTARSDPGAFEIAVAVSTTYLFVLTWIWRFQIILTSQTLAYKSLFGGVRRLDVAEIQKIKTQIDFKRKLGPFYRLLIFSGRSDKEEPLVINMKVFERRDIQRLVEFLKGKAEGDIRLDVVKTRRR